jgi:hypothetical protein
MQRATPRKFPDSASVSTRRAAPAIRSSVSFSLARSRSASSRCATVSGRCCTASSSARSSRQRARISSNSASLGRPTRA